MIEITRYSPCNKGSQIADFDMVLPSGMVLRKWRVIVTKKGHKFACGPSFKVENPPIQQEVWLSYIDFESKEKQKQFQEAVMKAVEIASTRI